MLQESVRPRVRLRSLNGPPMQPNPGQGRFTNTMPLAGSGIYFWICILWLQTSHAMELNKLFFFFFFGQTIYLRHLKPFCKYFPITYSLIPLFP